jgi:hypothetical protein
MDWKGSEDNREASVSTERDLTPWKLVNKSAGNASLAYGFQPPLKIPHTTRESHFATAPTAAG